MSGRAPPPLPPRPSAGLVGALMRRAESSPALGTRPRRARTMTAESPPQLPPPTSPMDEELKQRVRRRARSEHALQGLEEDMQGRDAELLRIMTLEASEWFSSLMEEKKATAAAAKTKTPKKTKKKKKKKKYESAEEFARSLATGVPLCELIHACLPDGDPIRAACSFTPDCEPGSFHARDNVHNFLVACAALGVPSVVLFDSEDLMQGRHLRNIINTLLQTSKALVPYGITPPKIVKYELDIEREEPVDERAVVEDDEWPKKGSTVDKGIQAVRKRHRGFSDAVRVRHVKNRPGMYKVTGKKPPRRTIIVPIRSVRKVLMVRVGGGWEPFMSFIERRIGFVSRTLHRDPVDE